LLLIVDLCSEKNEDDLIFSGDRDIGVDLIGGDEDYKIRLE
jgi:hypothetical protein